MSRSYKKVPIAKDRRCGKDMKKFANKKVRRTNELINGGTYKKVFDQWEIHDYVSRWTKEEAIEHYNKNKDKSWFSKRYSSLDDFLNKVYKRVKSKNNALSFCFLNSLKVGKYPK